jgi:hypothetical protein
VGSTNSDFGLIHAGPARTPKPCSCNIAQTRYSLANRTAIVPLLATEPISEDRQITLTQLIALRGLRSRGELSHPCSMTVGDQVTVKFFAAARAAAGCGSRDGGPGSLERVIVGLHAAFPALTAVTPGGSFPWTAYPRRGTRVARSLAQAQEWTCCPRPPAASRRWPTSVVRAAGTPGR